MRRCQSRRRCCTRKNRRPTLRRTGRSLRKRPAWSCPSAAAGTEGLLWSSARGSRSRVQATDSPSEGRGPAARYGGAGPTQPAASADSREHRLSFPCDGRHRERWDGGAVLPRRARLRPRRPLHFLRDRQLHRALRQRLLVVERPPARTLCRRDGHRQARPPAGHRAGAGATLRAAARHRAMPGRSAGCR